MGSSFSDRPVTKGDAFIYYAYRRKISAPLFSRKGSDPLNPKTFDAMLQIAQIESGAPRARFEPVELSRVVDNVCDAYTAVAEDTERRLVAKIEPGITLNGDRELLTQMLANLLENALRHTPARTLIEVRLERHRHAPRLVVSDNGSGIPAGERERVFRRFYRLDQSRATPGSGLGLSLVAAVAKLHDADITLEDNDPGLRVLVTFTRTARA